jgi:hypothetical protein
MGTLIVRRRLFVNLEAEVRSALGRFRAPGRNVAAAHPASLD